MTVVRGGGFKEELHAHSLSLYNHENSFAVKNYLFVVNILAYWPGANFATLDCHLSVMRFTSCSNHDNNSPATELTLVICVAHVAFFPFHSFYLFFIYLILISIFKHFFLFFLHMQREDEWKDEDLPSIWDVSCLPLDQHTLYSIF